VGQCRGRTQWGPGRKAKHDVASPGLSGRKNNWRGKKRRRGRFRSGAPSSVGNQRETGRLAKEESELPKTLKAKAAGVLTKKPRDGDGGTSRKKKERKVGAVQMKKV